MKRAAMTFVATLLAGCGAPTIQPGANHPDEEANAPGAIQVLGPDAGGTFYVVGLRQATPPGSTLTISATRQTTVEARADGSFAARVIGKVDGDFTIEGDDFSTTVQPAEPSKVNVNTSSLRGLQALPSIGPVRAEAIVARRDEGLFSRLDELQDVHGIGPKTVSDIAPYTEVRININAATRRQLMTLPTIGTVRAEAIIAWRETTGAFTAVAGLLNVPGIGANELSAIEAFVTAGQAPPDGPGAALVNVNVAGINELIELPGIGEALAAAIVDYRETELAFHVKEDLMRVPGIGSATFADLRDRITVGVTDVLVGTFQGDAAWTYSDEGALLNNGVTEDLLLTTGYGASDQEIIVTIVGGGDCPEPTSCAPVALKGVLDGGDDNTFGLLGYLPSNDGASFTIYDISGNEGQLTEEDLVLGFTAERDDETFSMELVAPRILQ